MKKIFLMCFLTISVLNGKDLGRFGSVFNVEEENFKKKVYRMLANRQNLQEDFKSESRKYLMEKTWDDLSPRKPNTIKRDLRCWNSVYVVPHDIFSPKGELIAKKGDSFDILQKLKDLGMDDKYRILFVSGNDKQQAEYAKKFLMRERILVMKKFEKDDGQNPAVLMFIGICLRDGKDGINVDAKKAKEYFKKAFDIAKDDEKKEAKILLDDIDNPNREKRPGSKGAILVEQRAVMEKGFVVLNGGNPFLWSKVIGRKENDGVAPDIQFDYGISLAFGVNFLPAVVFEKDGRIFIEEFRPEDGPKAFNEV